MAVIEWIRFLAGAVLLLLGILIFLIHHKFPETGNKAVNSFNSSVIPLGIQFRRSYKEFIKSQGITSVISHQIIRRHYISLRFTHFNTIFTGNHTLVEQLSKWLIKVNHTDIIQKLCIETGIQ